MTIMLTNAIHHVIFPTPKAGIRCLPKADLKKNDNDKLSIFFGLALKNWLCCFDSPNIYPTSTTKRDKLDSIVPRNTRERRKKTKRSTGTLSEEERQTRSRRSGKTYKQRAADAGRRHIA